MFVRPPRPTDGKLKSLVSPDFESIGLMSRRRSRYVDPLVQVRSSRIVGTRTNRSWELMLAKGAVSPAPKVKEFGNAGAKLDGNNNPERDTPTVAWLTTFELEGPGVTNGQRVIPRKDLSGFRISGELLGHRVHRVRLYTTGNVEASKQLLLFGRIPVNAGRIGIVRSTRRRIKPEPAGIDAVAGGQIIWHAGSVG